MNMNLREFLCNSRLVNASIPLCDRMKSVAKAKVLGVPWDFANDTIRLKLKIASFRDLWSKSYNWDDPLDQEDAAKWSDLLHQ
ncbi:hypothetical protein OESDEN_14094, partial [Oesophagostomum dentatum]